jgi:deoxyribodipyrimidine photo-lyase
MTTIVWFRYDLRIADNPALTAAVGRGAIVPVFSWNPEEETPFPPGAASRWWLHQSLTALDHRLKAMGAPLVLRQGDSLQNLRDLVRQTDASAVFWNRCYEPALIARDREVKARLTEDGLIVYSYNASLLHEPWTIATKSQKPFQVFTPFYRTCLAQPPPAPPVPPPASLRASTQEADTCALAELALEPIVDWAEGLRRAWTPGEQGALHRLRDAPLTGYATDRDWPDRAGTSSLSPHLHFGEIGPRQVWKSVIDRHGQSEVAQPFLRQLIWREFAHHLLYHFPHTPTQPLRSEFARFPWRQDAKMLQAWQRGRTGYPIVDAGIRELWTTGWMHNRVRLIVASFLVKHLRLHWEEGAHWFWDTLVDADLANNTLGWQWSAGCGADAAPYFRIFNPILQGEKFDPNGAYVRRWLPELATVPNRWIHQPWTMPELERQRIGFELGRTYPNPIVEHATARAEALSAFQSFRKQQLQAL